MATATKELGLELYSNEEFRKEVELSFGEEFVQECIDLAITRLPDEPEQAHRKAHSNTGYKHISWWYQNQKETIYSGNWVKKDRQHGKAKPKEDNKPKETKQQKPANTTKAPRDRRRKKHLRGAPPEYVNNDNKSCHLTPEQSQALALKEQEAIKQNKADKVKKGYIAPTKKKAKHYTPPPLKSDYVPKESKATIIIKKKRS